MTELPGGWAPAKLKDVVELRTGPFGSSLHQSDYVDGGIPIVNPMHIEDGRIRPSQKHRVSETTAERLSEFRLQEGDIVLGRRGEMGRCAVVQANQVGWLCGTGSLIVRSGQCIAADFLQGVLSSDAVIKYLMAESVGSTMVNLNQRILLDLDLIIPPRPEQVRIVEKLDELLSDLDAGVAELKAAQRKLEQYRQSLLKAAVEGALTAEWRASHGKQQSGAELLQRILSERRARWEQKQLAKFAGQGKTPPKDWRAKYPEPVAPDLAELPPLPGGWTWASLDQLIAESSYGTSVKCGYESSGDPVLRIPNVSGGKLDFSDIKFASESLNLEPEDYLALGDVLVIRTNGSIGLVGRAAVVLGPLPAPYYFASYLLRLRCAETSYTYRWISAALASHSGRRWIEARAASSAGQHNISLSTLLTMPLPLPPLAEQAEALNATDVALEYVEQHQRVLDKSLAQAVAQRKNLLKAAFAGQLVPQDPNDEPASELLARIRAERASNDDSAPRRRRQTA